MNKNVFLSLLTVFFFTITSGMAVTKKIHIPEKQKKENEFGPYGRFSFDYKAESENLVLLWEKSFGKTPETYSDISRRFYPKEILEEGERFYKYYVEKLKFSDKKKSHGATKKMIIWMFNDDNSTAYGWGDEGVGMMWMRPCRTNSYPYCALAHEMGHSFQYLVEADGSRSFTACPLVEYTSQWMLWQVYPEWCTLEKYHLDAYMKQTHYSLFNEINQYHAPQFMEYWANKHGVDIISRIWKEAVDKEDPISTYKRITGINQEQFNDEIYDAATKFVTWDIKRIKDVCSIYANQHTCKMDKEKNNWYKIAQSRCPQNYGYNAIRLNVPKAGTKVELEFEGIAGDRNFRSLNIDKAGWRYGFVAVTLKGKRIYGKANKGNNGKNDKIYFTVPEDTHFLWIVVTGAPDEHLDYYKRWHELSKEKGKETQWPYRIRISGTDLHNNVINGSN